jgi:hypothetical protein
MVPGVKQHKDDKDLAGNVVELSEKPSIWCNAGYFFNVLKYVVERTILKCENNTGKKTQDERTETKPR